LGALALERLDALGALERELARERSQPEAPRVVGDDAGRVRRREDPVAPSQRSAMRGISGRSTSEA